MRRINNDKVTYHFTASNKPVLDCGSGEEIIFSTLDCFSNKLLDPNSKLGIDNPPESNPATGPLYVEKAMPGDILKVEVLNIKVGEVGVNLIGPINPNIKNGINETQINRLKIESDQVAVNDEIKIPIRPMIGTIGVAPSNSHIPTVHVGRHGGNMDCNMIRKGSIVYLPVFVEGGLLSIGDLHALMGDGEIGENGLEIEGEVEVRVSVVKGQSIISPIVNYGNKWATISSSSTIEKAANEATNYMLDLLTKNIGMPPSEAMTLVNLIGNLRICQLCNLEKTALMEVELNKSLL